MNLNTLYKKVKRIFPNALKENVKFLFFCIPYLYNRFIKRRKIIMLFGIPIHGNLGDQAIAYAERLYLQENHNEFKVIEISSNLIDKHLIKLKKMLKNELIMIHGGGYMGTIWFEEERILRDVITSFPKNKIIIYPQTIYYEDTKWGNEELGKSVDIYNNHKNLHICARDKSSYEIMKNNYTKANILFTPDIVSYLDMTKPEFKRNGILLCIRGDKESVLDRGYKERILKTASKHSENIKFTDTVIPLIIPESRREIHLNEKFDEFKRSNLIITDRLHGMMFAAITSTPCIALNNKSGKVKGVYEWLRHLEYIKFVEDIENSQGYIQELLEIPHKKYSNNVALEKFKQIGNLIK